MIEGTINIKSNIDEMLFMECLLNQYHSGYFVQHILMFHALANRWHINKFTYYFNMIGGGEND